MDIAMVVLLSILVFLQLLTLGALGNLITLLKNMDVSTTDIRKEMYRR